MKITISDIEQINKDNEAIIEAWKGESINTIVETLPHPVDDLLEALEIVLGENGKDKDMIFRKLKDQLINYMIDEAIITLHNYPVAGEGEE